MQHQYNLFPNFQKNKCSKQFGISTEISLINYELLIKRKYTFSRTFCHFSIY